MVNSGGGKYGTGGFRTQAVCILSNSNVNNCKKNKEKKKLMIERVSYDMFSREKLTERLIRSGGSCRDTSIMKV